MTRNELQTMIDTSNKLLKQIYSTRECSDGWCSTCNYNAICEVARLIHKLLELQDTKLMRNAKGELKDDNN